MKRLALVSVLALLASLLWAVPAAAEGTVDLNVRGVEVEADAGFAHFVGSVSNHERNLWGAFDVEVLYSGGTVGQAGSEQTTVGGTWKLKLYKGWRYLGTFAGTVAAGGKIKWTTDDLATVSATLNTYSGSQFATFSGVLDRRGWPPIPPRIKGTLSILVSSPSLVAS